MSKTLKGVVAGSILSLLMVSASFALIWPGNPPPPPDIFPPAATITSPANNATVSSTIAVVVSNSDNVGVTSLELYTDNTLTTSTTNPSASYSFPLDTTILANTTHALMAKAYDAAGNVSSSAVITITVSNKSSDTTPPTVPTGLTVTVVTTSTVSLSWTASTDPDSTVAGYYVYRGGIQIGTSATTNYADAGLAPSTTYTYTVSAHDPSGNTSAQSTSVSTTTMAIDTTPPVVTIAAPVAGATISGTSTLTAIATDNIAVASVQFKVDNNLVGSPITNPPYAYPLNTATLSSASHIIGAVAKDTSGNTGNAATITVLVQNVTSTDTTPPSVPTGLSAPSVTPSQVTLVWATSTDPDSGIAFYTIYRDGNQIGTAALTTLTDSGLNSEQTYIYTVSATDPSGNTSARSTGLSVTTQSSGGGGGGGGGDGGGGGGGGGGGNGGGGNNGGSGSTTDLKALLQSLILELNSLLARLNTTLVAQFNRNLTIGASGKDVQTLQVFLNDNGYLVASSGAGSPGNEVSYFGTRTRQALMKFQAANNLPATGFFGPLTRNFLKNKWQ